MSVYVRDDADSISRGFEDSRLGRRQDNGDSNGVANLPGSRLSVIQTPSIGLPLSILSLPSSSSSSTTTTTTTPTPTPTSTPTPSSSSTSTTSSTSSNSNTVPGSTASSTSPPESTSTSTSTAPSPSSSAPMSTEVAITFQPVSQVTACSTQVLDWSFSGSPNQDVKLVLISSSTQSLGPSPGIAQPGSDLSGIVEVIAPSVAVTTAQFSWSVAVQPGLYEVQAFDSANATAGSTTPFSVVLGNDVSCLSSSSSVAGASSTSTPLSQTSQTSNSPSTNTMSSANTSSSSAAGADSGSNNQRTSTSHGLSGGGIAGVVIAALVGLLALILLILFLLRRRLFASARRPIPSSPKRRSSKEKPAWASLGSLDSTHGGVNAGTGVGPDFQFGQFGQIGGIGVVGAGSKNNVISTTASSAGAVENLAGYGSHNYNNSSFRDPRDPFVTPAPSRAGSHHAGVSPTGSFAQNSEDDLSPPSSAAHEAPSPLNAASVLDRGHGHGPYPYTFPNQAISVGSAIGAAGALGVMRKDSSKRRSTSTMASVNENSPISQTHSGSIGSHHVHSSSSVVAPPLGSSPSGAGSPGNMSRRTTLRKPVPLYNEAHEMTATSSSSTAGSPVAVMPATPTQAYSPVSPSRSSGDSTRTGIGRGAVPAQFAHPALEHKPSFGEKPMTHVLIPDMPPQ